MPFYQKRGIVSAQRVIQTRKCALEPNLNRLTIPNIPGHGWRKNDH